tara:strand:+ start:332 stop:985 length:654 start_codon:yes stop_codon:yes gene_type:complete
MGCNCGKNKSKTATQQSLSKAFEESQRSNAPDRSDSIPQIQTETFREHNKTTIKIKKVQTESEVETPKLPSFGQKVKNFTKAMTSRAVKGRVEDAILELRVLSCHGNDEIPPCPYRGDSNVRDGFHFCTACGCGDKPHTWLNNPEDPNAYTKLHYPWVSCPIRNPGFGDYKPHALEDAKELESKKPGMDRKKIIEIYLKANGKEIPEHPAAQPNNGE